MSEDIKNSTDGVQPGDETAGAPLFNVVVKCYRDVYRRAGISFVRGENTILGITEEQARCLDRDSVLKIISGSPAPEPEESGTLDDVGVDSQLNDALTAQQLSLRILAAVAGLDKANPELFTTAGSPKVAAVSAALGESITSEQLKAAMATQGEDA